MWRNVTSVLLSTRRVVLVMKRLASHCGHQYTCNMPLHEEESDQEFNHRWEAYFNNPDLDGWDCRQGINLLAGVDAIPEPQVQIAILRACRRLHDFSMAVRYLECMKDKANAADKKIYPYILQEIRPVLDELGINTPEELGYDKPELQMINVFEYPP
ncbi:hypothetical protein L9F63_022473 [Diploptera punctata]|uniref:Cytochrome c oxidase subunit 5A, mitochondrial n=1 Tax=Diploptera punctata TaxID=6984 RepID=A0AAD8EAI4_DIPPU|nr:hypothetical protein L9F63_022473 [Diploptera punctata]